jgi:hypothetical protein
MVVAGGESGVVVVGAVIVVEGQWQSRESRSYCLVVVEVRSKSNARDFVDYFT